MGAVFLATRADGVTDLRVAIKIVPRVATPEDIARFRRERRILGRLEHPNIARLYDGGTTEDGLPYFVMEYVEGSPIDVFCDRRQLSIAGRLALFRRVCAAVEHAHRNLVIHRDLKPTNVLIDALGNPKLLDFGIAKLLQPEEGDGETETTFDRRPLTPNYASPEQLLGQPVSTASDVYSLGVLLYRLLTGRLPRQLNHLGSLEVEKALGETPTRPSVAARGSSTAVASLPWRSQHRPDADLDSIVLKALAADPEERYASVTQLSEDLRRYGDGLPVSARPPRLSYRIGKFVRRHRTAAVAMSVMLTMAFGFAAIGIHQASRLAEERDRAVVEGRKARAAWQFLADLVRYSDPRLAPGEEVTLRAVLDRGAAEVREGLHDQPEVRAALLDAMGLAYVSLGRDAEARALLEEALRERRAVLGDDHPEVAASLTHLGLLLSDQSAYPLAEKKLTEAIAILEPQADREPERLADARELLAEVLFLTGRLDAAEALYESAVGLRRAAPGDPTAAIASNRFKLACLLTERGRYGEAETLFRDALARQREILGDDHAHVAATLNHLATLRRRQGDLEEAEALLREAIAIRRPIYGEDHVEVGQSLNNLASVLAAQGDLAEAEELFRRCLGMLETRFGSRHRDVAVTYNNLGRVLRLRGDLAGAEAALRKSLEITREVLPPDHPGAAYPLTQLGELLLDLGRKREAERLLQEALRLRRTALGADHPEMRESERLLARARQG
jgi:serine/threonine-protein kinase